MPDAKRVLLTGGKGFVGRRLHALLDRERPDWEVAAPGGPQDLEGGLDVTDPRQTAEVVRTFQPTVVVHLAAVSAVTAAVKDPRAAWSVNLGGTLNLTEALLEHAPGCRLVHVSSAEVYGLSLGERRPTDETALLQPMNPYAASKAAGDILVRQCSATGLDAVVARPFNHTGAGQAEVFALPSFAAQIARIEAGLQTPVLMVGDLDEERDFLDVDDVATAYLKMIEFRNDSGRAAVFNIASGTPRRIGDVLNGLIERARVRVEVRVDPERLRRSTMRGVTGDAAALARATGWRPTRPFEQTLDDLVAWSRSQTAAG